MAYIPKEHRNMGLLPRCRRMGGEVFSWPTDLQDRLRGILDSDTEFLPIGYGSYAEYYDELARLRRVYFRNATAVLLLEDFEKEVRRRNVKEEWSVVRYCGPANAIPDLTPGRNYYWPSSKATPVYEGIIDDEEVTSYLYPTKREWWYVISDPTGMAYKAVHGYAPGCSVADYAAATNQPDWFLEAFDDGK